MWEIFEDKEGNLWVGTLGSGLDVFNKKTSSFKHYQYNADDSGSLVANYVSAILQDSKKNIWVGTNVGITVFEKNTTSRYTNDKNRLSSNAIICLI